MVSLVQRHELSDAVKADDDLLRVRALLDGEAVNIASTLDNDIRGQLLLSISLSDAKKFHEIATDLSKRRIDSNSDWCQDDFLVFLLLLGNQLFEPSLSLLEQIIEARRHTRNSLPQKINEIFAALSRQEFSMDGELAFLKVPFLHLVGNLKIGSEEAGKILTGVSDARLWDQLSPFLRLLAQKAHDLALTSRTPKIAETSEELVEGFKRHASNLTIGQWRSLVWSLPAKLLVYIVSVVIGLGLVVVLFGFGRELAVNGFTDEGNRERPNQVSIEGVSTTPPSLPAEAAILKSFLQNIPATPGKNILTLTLTCDPFLDSTSSFVIEVSHSEKVIQNAIAFTQETDTGERPFTVIPVQKDSGQFRIILPPLEKGDQLVILVNIEVGPKEAEDTLKRRFVLRSMP